MANPKWPSRHSRRIYLFAEPEEEVVKGFRNEDLAEEALKILRAAGHIYHFIRSRRWGELDANGIDFLVWPEYNWTVPLQIKSSETGRREHLSEYGETVPSCVVVEPFDTVSDLAGKILKELGLEVKPLEELLVKILWEANMETEGFDIRDISREISVVQAATGSH